MRATASWRAVVLVGSMFVARATSAAAAPVDVSNHSITCNTVTGSARITPALNDVGLGVPVFKIKGKLGGCVDNTNPGVLIDSGSFSGTIVGITTFCPDLIDSVPWSGTLTYRWKANRDTPIAPTTSTQQINSFTGFLLSPGGSFGGATYITLSFGTASVSGAFTGGDGGSTSSNVIATSDDFYNRYASLCAGSVGVKSLTFGIGTVTLQ